jgi:hypothetical protein
MKTTFLALAAMLAFGAQAQQTTHVQGHVKSDGTYVQPHTRTTPNSTTSDNFGTKGNYNPYTGKAGKK